MSDLSKRMPQWVIKCEGIGIIAGTLAYTRQAAYDFCREGGASNKELRDAGYSAVKISIKETHG